MGDDPDSERKRGIDRGDLLVLLACDCEADVGDCVNVDDECALGRVRAEVVGYVRPESSGCVKTGGFSARNAAAVDRKPARCR